MYVAVLLPVTKTVYCLRDTTNDRWYGNFAYINQEQAIGIAELESKDKHLAIKAFPVEVEVASLSEQRIEDFFVVLLLDNDNKILYAKATYENPLENRVLIDSLCSAPDVGSLKVLEVQVNRYAESN